MKDTHIKTNYKDFSMLFIWVFFFCRWVYGILGWSGSMTSDEIKYYVKYLANNRNESQETDERDLILVYDNT